jgi:proline iminopeptidase
MPKRMTALLDVGDGNFVHWNARGGKSGRPALALHGGPGSGLSQSVCRWFPASTWRLYRFDQRGCGLSRPHASDPAADMAPNTTAHLLRDIETLRAHVGVEHWVVFGSSWGATLALAYAQHMPTRVAGIVLAGATTTRASEIDWLYRGLAPLFPEEWQRFCAGAPPGTADAGLVEAYRRLLESPDPAVRLRAADDWHAWEAATFAIVPGGKPPAKWRNARYRLARARIIAHYFANGAWLEDGQLLRNAKLLDGIPGEIVQGRLDLEAPLATAWELAHAWRDADLTVVPKAAHSTANRAMASAIARAVKRMAKRARY